MINKTLRQSVSSQLLVRNESFFLFFFLVRDEIHHGENLPDPISRLPIDFIKHFDKSGVQ